jgi:heme/copper-type cytochrome/quinol oxidase subunit 1
VRLHSFAFGLLALAGLAVTALFKIQPIDLFYHDTYVVVAIGHLAFAAATLFGAFAVGWTIFEAFARRALHEALGQTHFWMTLAGVLILTASLSPLGFKLAHESPHTMGTLMMGALLFTFAAQLLFPLALVVSWSKPKVA